MQLPQRVRADDKPQRLGARPSRSLNIAILSANKAFARARSMCGGSSDQKRRPLNKEVEYLDALVRGVYAKRDLPAGHVFNHDTINEDFYLAIPLQKGQMSCRELMSGETLQRPVRKDEAINIESIGSNCAYTDALKELILKRGL